MEDWKKNEDAEISVFAAKYCPKVKLIHSAVTEARTGQTLIPPIWGWWRLLWQHSQYTQFCLYVGYYFSLCHALQSFFFKMGHLHHAESAPLGIRPPDLIICILRCITAVKRRSKAGWEGGDFVCTSASYNKMWSASPHSWVITRCL